MLKGIVKSLLMLVPPACIMAQSTTMVTGPVSSATGIPYTGSMTVQSQAKTNFGTVITGTVATVVINAGVITPFSLVPNDTSVQNLTSYAVTFGNQDKWVCVVPTVAAAVSTTASTTASSTTITVASSAGLVNGQLVNGSGIPINTTVTNVAGTAITLSQNASATASGVAVTFSTTANFGTICYPNTIPPTAPAPLPVTLILPSPTNFNVIATVAGQAAWASVGSLFTGCSNTAALLTYTGVCVGNGGFASTPASTQVWFSNSSGQPVGSTAFTFAGSTLSLGVLGSSTGGLLLSNSAAGTEQILFTNSTTTTPSAAFADFTPVGAATAMRIHLRPNDTSGSYGATVDSYNSSDTINSAHMFVGLTGIGQGALITNNIGTPAVPVSSIIIGENSGAALTSIKFQFANTTLFSMSSAGGFQIGTQTHAPVLSSPTDGYLIMSSSTTGVNPIFVVAPNTSDSGHTGVLVVQNAYDSNNDGFMSMGVGGSVAQINIGVNGTGTEPTSMRIGELSGTSLASICFRFKDVCQWTLTSAGNLSLGTAAVPGSVTLVGASGTIASISTAGAFVAASTITAGNGSNVVYRCATAGTLPAGALTITTGSCGTTTDSGLRIQ